MTDQELLESAAKAAGIIAGWHCAEDEVNDRASELAVSEGMWLKGQRTADNSSYWNPLTNDGDALRLANKLRINIYNGHPESTVCGRAGITGFRVEVVSDANAATRRAIVLAAAQIEVDKTEGTR